MGDHQLAFAEYLPGAVTEEIAGPLVKPLHNGETKAVPRPQIPS
jgi:hypothetical protein